MRFVSIDTETELIEPGLLAPPAVCLSWCMEGGSKGLLHAQLEADTTQDILKGWLDCNVTCLIGANTAYDMAVLLQAFPRLSPYIFKAYNESRVFDIQVNQMLVDIAEGVPKIRRKSLAHLEEKYLGRDRSADKAGPDVWRLRYKELEAVPIAEWPEAASSYAIADAVGTLECFMYQKEHYGHWLHNAQAQARASFSLHLMSCWGVMTDPERIAVFKEFSVKEYDRLSAILFEHELLKTDKKGKVSKDTKKAKALMYQVALEDRRKIKYTDKGVEVFKKKFYDPNDEGEEFLQDSRHMTLSQAEMIALRRKYIAMDADTCQETHHPVLQAYGERTSIATDVNTRIPDLLKGTETPIQAHYNVLVASGRTSCDKGRQNGFQMQNPPRKGPVRECFISRPGYYFADADFDGLELRTMAQVCHVITQGNSKLADALNEGLDPHLMVGAQLLSISYKEATQRKRDKKVKEARQLGKVANFGFPGLLGARGFVDYALGYGVKIDLAMSRRIKQAWEKAWPEFVRFFRHVRDLVDDELNNSPLEQLYVKRFRGNCSMPAGCNTLFQGLGSDGAKESCWYVTRACYDPSENNVMFGARPCIFVHDQIITEVLVDKAHEQATEMARLMVEGCNVFLPDVPATCTAALSKHWCKDVEDVYDANGRLVPWDIYKEKKMECFYREGTRVKW